MYDLTIVNPTKNPFEIGSGINEACEVEIDFIAYEEVGLGTVQTYISSELLASGTYSALGDSGTWNVSLTAGTSDADWQVSVGFTGDASGYSRTFTATCTQPSNDPPTLSFTDNSSGDNVQLIQDNATFASGKIEMDPSWAPKSIYLTSDVS